MSDDRFTDELNESFGKLRAEDARRAPDFETMLRKAQAEAPLSLPRHRLRNWSLAVGTLAAAAMAGVMLTAGDPDAEFEARVAAYTTDIGSIGWASPTDVLLDVPGMDLLTTVPSIGTGALSTTGPGGENPGNEG